MVKAVVVNNRVAPSGADLVTALVPKTAPPPGRFSAITVLPKRLDMPCEILRAMMSVLPPGA